MDVDGLLLDIDGVLAVSWEPIAGAVDTLSWIRDHDLPFRLLTNTTARPRGALAGTFATRVRGRARGHRRPLLHGWYLRTHFAGARVFLLRTATHVRTFGTSRCRPAESADVVVRRGVRFSYAAVNHIFVVE
jgi:hypothetical protein